MNMDAVVQKLIKETNEDIVVWSDIDAFEHACNGTLESIPPLYFNEFRFLNSEIAYIGFRPGFIFILLDETFQSGKHGRSFDEKNLYISQDFLQEFHSVNLSNDNVLQLSEAIVASIDRKTYSDSLFLSYLNSDI